MKFTFYLFPCVFLALLLVFGTRSSAAQQLDPRFERTRLTLPAMTDNAAEQADGRLIVSVIPPAVIYNGRPRPSILRLNQSGLPDTTFGAHWLTSGGATQNMRVLPNGKILLVGGAASIVESLGGLDLARRTGVIVLEQSGDLDRNYYYREGGEASSGAVQPDGKILIGGSFTSYNGQPAHGLVRLLGNGQLDPSFLINPAQAGFNGEVNTIEVLPNGKIMVSGRFTTYASMPMVHLARLLPDGRLDPTFDAHLNAADWFQSFAVQPDGKVVITNAEGPVGRVRRLLPDGSADPGFVTTNSMSYFGLNQQVDHGVTVQPDGGILIAGGILGFNGQNSSGLVRLLPNGAPDPRASLGNDFEGVLTAICPLRSGGALVCGAFTTFHNRPTGMFRLTPTGQIDPAFALPISAPGRISASLLLASGKTVVAGAFNSINGVPATNLALLNDDGSVDVAFTSALPLLNAEVQALAPGPQGTVYVGGAFYDSANPSLRHLLRLNANGMQDPTFDAHLTKPLYGLTTVSTLASYPDGRLLVGGSFPYASPQLFRLTAQGNFDPSFAPDFGPAPPYVTYVSLVALQRDENVAVVTTGNTSWQIKASGALSGTHNSTPRYVRAITVQPDGNILVAGDFPSFAGSKRGLIARLLPSGALDTSFDAGPFVQPSSGPPQVTALAVQSDGRILCAGFFSSIAGQDHHGIARLLANGQVDSSFGDKAPVAMAASFLAIHPNGRLLVGASALDAKTNRPLTQGLTSLIMPGLTGAAPVGALKRTSPGMSVFPTPASQTVTVEGDEGATRVEARVYDVYGRMVLQASATAARLDLSVSSLASGNYVVHISTDSGTTYRKMTVQH
ncbi:T9SS type A sorting domain-containing protein [Hymenobacter sp. M29]|uniref:T9SS type A sorting domain-containing protein n=1 Tax=Hymenobacter mellowenesis TaxID=3063995 RepID=A0ABT9AGY8_9BACT|nr:T9SS type A sorting domain-containing protein [Hymenobacter sp. M29]MDO7849106.1 T9SS type A sorting domain-containing protein [Hymenobacter sp. M29]